MKINGNSEPRCYGCIIEDLWEFKDKTDSKICIENTGIKVKHYLLKDRDRLSKVL